MKRFVIRNYGPSRQFPYKAEQICISNDCAIETDNAELAGFMRGQEQVFVTDRGSDVGENFDAQKVEPEAAVNPGVKDTDEISYDEMSYKELQALAKDRQLKHTGIKKALLIKSLQKYDTAPIKDAPETPTEDEPIEPEIDKG